MTSPAPPPDPTPERGVGGGRKGRRRQGGPPPKASSGFPLAVVLAAIAIAIAGTALVATLARPGPAAVTPSAAASPSCRTIAWDALPTSDTLPEGWTVQGSGFYTDGYGAQFTGPVASGAQAAPVINVRVSCFGSDGHAALTRSHESDLAAGGTDVPFSDLGDELVATKDASGTTTSVYILNGQLVASIAAQGVNADDLDLAAGAIDDAMATAEEIAGASPVDEPTASDEGAIPSEDTASDVPEETPTHTFPELEAVLPAALDGTPLTHESSTATDAISGDPSSEALFAWLKTQGKSSDQLQFAAGYDPTGTIDAGFTAVRIDGIAPDKLRQELVTTWLAGSGSGATTSTKTIGGKTVTVVDYGDQGSVDYLFDRGDAVIVFSASDPALVERTLTALK